MEKVRNSVLIVDDEPINIAALTHILHPLYTVYVCKDGQSTLDTALELMPDVILLDVIMPEISGFDVIAKLKKNEDTKNIPVIFVTGLTQQADEEQGLILGASDYIHKPFNPAIVKLRVQNQMQIVNQVRMIHHLSMTDALTGTANRRHFNSRLNQEWQRAVRDSTAVSLLLLDVDDFKKVNDTHGHLFGDAVLQNIANNIKLCLKRPMDLIARWGGEEFAILLPNTHIEGAIYVAEGVRQAIERRDHPAPELGDVMVTVSIGASCVLPDMEKELMEFVNEADQALYRAKELGKNRVCAFEE